jgi:hypothetical protein
MVMSCSRLSSNLSEVLVKSKPEVFLNSLFCVMIPDWSNGFGDGEV